MKDTTKTNEKYKESNYDTMKSDDIGNTLDSQKKINPPSKSRFTCRLCLAVFSAVMGSVEFGYNTGVINAPETYIKAFMNSTTLYRTGKLMEDSKITSLYALVVAIFAVGGVIGGLAAGWWADFFGRKFGMIFNNIIGIASCILMYLSFTAKSYEMIIVGRFLVGISCVIATRAVVLYPMAGGGLIHLWTTQCLGLFTGLTPMYLSEISSSNIRGALGVLHQLGVVIGLLTSQILGFPEICGNDKYWNLLLGLGLVPCAIQIITMPLCPESPRYLLLTKNKESQARKSLQILLGKHEINAEIEEMKSESRKDTAEESVSLFRLLKENTLRRPLIISIVMQLSQQLSGINAIFYYSNKLFESAGLEKTTAAHATSGVGGTMVVMTIITIPLMDRVGRRTLHLIGLGGMFIFSILITLSLALTFLASWLQIANIVVSLLYVVFFAVGPGSIPWLIVSEIFSQGPRPAAMSVSVFTNWVANFAVGYSFPYMQEGLGNFSFLPFTFLLGIFFLFTLKYVPETKNKSIEEIARLWNKGNSSDTRHDYHPTVSLNDINTKVERM